MEATEVGIREFRADLAEYIAASSPVAVTLPVFVNIVVRFFKQLSAFFPSLVSLAPARG